MRKLTSGTWDEKNPFSGRAGAFPIAFPLLAGPGSITTTIVLLQVLGLIAGSYRSCNRYGPNICCTTLCRYNVFLGRIDSVIVARRMAIFIAAIAFQFVIEGIKFYFP